MGTVEKKLIYRGRKGFNDVKEYIKTINPDLPDQIIQKGYFKDAIEQWKEGGYSAEDKQAWNLYSRANRILASGFNMFTRFKIIADTCNKIWGKLTNCTIYDIKGNGFKVDINVASDLGGKLYYGTTKLYMKNEVVGVFSVDKYTFNVTGLSMLTQYYFYIKNTAIGKEGRTGIYSQKTTERIPIIINIGNLAVDRASTTSAGYTFINYDNPANHDGKIYTIEMWSVDDLYNAEVAIFEEISPSYFTTRDNVFIGTVIKGAKRTFPVELNVKVGDYLGIYTPTGRIERDISGYAGLWYANGDKIPCINQWFILLANYTVSLYGIGEA